MKLGFFLYVVMAFTSATAIFLGTDEAAKYIDGETLFYVRGINGVIDGVATTLKGFTSESFSNWLAARKANGNGHAKPTEPKT